MATLFLYLIPAYPIKNGPRSLPEIHAGGLPRPDQVVPVAGSRYLGSTFARGLRTAVRSLFGMIS